MNLLLDTHAWLWLVSAPERVPARVHQALVSSSLFWSTVCVWELANKHASGKLTLPDDPRSFVRTRSQAAGARPLPITHDHAFTAAVLPQHHRDPFDRLLVAQAQVDGLTLVTGDPQLSAYDVEILWA